MKTLAELDASKGNNVDAIRFVAATLVTHAYAVSGHGNDERLAGLTGFIGSESLAVEVFFW
jgi:peptidoglycan/LPS O-acetylase OafA/YrhL